MPRLQSYPKPRGAARVALLALLALPVGRAAGQGVGPAVAELERELAADVVADSVGSVAAAVFEGDVVVWRAAFGWADRRTRTLATPSTVYRAGSITKTVTALVLVRLVDAGVIELDDPVVRYLPELRRLRRDGRAGAGGRPITFRDLATHTSGLAREPGRVRSFGRGSFREWKRKTVAAIPRTEVVGVPGERYRYSNIGYALLGLALERAAGRPFEILADSLVFRPLGMIATSLFPDRELRRRVATGYVNLPGDTADPRVPRAEHRGRGYRVPGGGVYSTVDDLARLGMALTGAVPLIPDSLRLLMLTSARPPDRPDDPDTGGVPGTGRAGYGLGVQLVDLGTLTLAGHSGRVPGYSAYLLVDPDRRTGVVLLRSYTHGATNLGATATRLLLRLAPPG